MGQTVGHLRRFANARADATTRLSRKEGAENLQADRDALSRARLTGGVHWRGRTLVLRFFGEMGEVGLESLQFLVAQPIEIHERVSGALYRANQLIELHVERGGVAVLRGLGEEHHEERDD